MSKTKTFTILISLWMGLLGSACALTPEPTEIGGSPSPPGDQTTTLASTPIERTGTGPSDNSPDSTDSEFAALAVPRLSTDLVGGCRVGDRSSRGPQPGEPAIDFTLLDVNEQSYTLSHLLLTKPVIMIFGSFT